jgi:hypothetical protein
VKSGGVIGVLSGLTDGIILGFLPLFTKPRRREFLGSAHTESCIEGIERDRHGHTGLSGSEDRPLHVAGLDNYAISCTLGIQLHMR